MDLGPYLEASVHAVNLCTEGSGSSRLQRPVSQSLATCPYRTTQDGSALAKGAKAARALPQVVTHSTAEKILLPWQSEPCDTSSKQSDWLADACLCEALTRAASASLSSLFPEYKLLE